MILAIYGMGGSGKEVYEMVVSNNELNNKWESIMFIDDRGEINGYRGCRVMSYNELKDSFLPEKIRIVIAVGEPESRRMLAEKVKGDDYKLATIIHPLAYVSYDAIIGEGVIIHEGVFVSAEAVIHNNTCINGKTIIGHNVVIGDNCQISSMVIIGGATVIYNNVFVGMSASIADHIEVGNDSILSMGSVVMKTVKESRIVMGNPAREIAVNTDKKVFK